MNKKINAEIIADSVDERGNRIISYILTYPRIIHAEVMTHRMFSRNAASSRAIPFAKMVNDIQEDPFIPIAWQKDHKGMQGSEYFTMEDNKQLLCSGKYYSDLDKLEERWLTARDKAVQFASDLSNNGLTKQLCNRLLEPFQWYTCLVTATEFDNFFELRCPKYKLFGLGGDPQKSRKDWLKHMQFSSSLHPSQYPKTEEEWWGISESGAEIHIQALAETMYDAMNESIPNQLKSGDWHIPFGDKMSEISILAIVDNYNISDVQNDLIEKAKIQIATARCARLSYMSFDGEIDYEKDIKLHDHLLESKHFSPFEHCARAMSDEEYYSFVKGKEIIEYFEEEPNIYTFEDSSCGWCNNFRGFIQYRYLIENNKN